MILAGIWFIFYTLSRRIYRFLVTNKGVEPSIFSNRLETISQITGAKVHFQISYNFN